MIMSGGRDDLVTSAQAVLTNHVWTDIGVRRIGEVAVGRATDESGLARWIEPAFGRAIGNNDRWRSRGLCFTRLMLMLVLVSTATAATTTALRLIATVTASAIPPPSPPATISLLTALATALTAALTAALATLATLATALVAVLTRPVLLLSTWVALLSIFRPINRVVWFIRLATTRSTVAT